MGTVGFKVYVISTLYHHDIKVDISAANLKILANGIYDSIFWTQR